MNFNVETYRGCGKGGWAFSVFPNIRLNYDALEGSSWRSFTVELSWLFWEAVSNWEWKKNRG